MRQSVIIFCHYGNSNYLNFTLGQVRLSNPDSRIVLLGDRENQHVALNNGIEHFFFENYSNTKEMSDFEKEYKYIAGKNFDQEFWAKYVFKRWFYVHEFIQKENINSFWHFDSDNMILSDLKTQEYKFENYDCTEQCSGICMRGFIYSFNVVDGYVKKINTLFQDFRYLEQQREDFIENPNYAYTEMRAYKAYKEQEKINSIRLNSIIDNETFDDCICHQDGYEQYNKKLDNHFLKKMFVDKNGYIYCYNLELGQYIKMNNINLSWVPLRLFELILKISSDSNFIKRNALEKRDGFYILDIYTLTKKERIKNSLRKILPYSAQQYIKAIKKRLLY